MLFLSVIICSRNKRLSKDFLSNIEKTIGCEYELIIIDNSENSYSIFEAYNRGIDKSSAEILCFIHEDILFHTKNWGVNIMNIYSEVPDAGLVGVAGSRIKSDVPMGWWEHNKKHLVKNMIQHRQDGTKDKLRIGFETSSEQEVAVIDGVFMCLKKESQIRFNENLKGFHNYDQSLSLDCLKKGYKVLVTNKVLLEHFSNGTIDSSWVNSTYKFHKLYKPYLPIIIGSGRICESDNLKQLSRFIFHCKNTGNAKLALKSWMRLLRKQPISLEYWSHSLYFLKFFKSKII